MLKRNLFRYFAKNIIIVVSLVLIWRGIWYVLDYIDINFISSHIYTAIGGIILGLLLLYIPDLEEKFVQLKSDGQSVSDRLSEFLELAGNAYLAFKFAEQPEKRDLIKTVTSNRLIDGTNAHLELKFPFNEVASRHKNSNGSGGGN